jgi:uncharacterized protein (TIGR02001 family)
MPYPSRAAAFALLIAVGAAPARASPADAPPALSFSEYAMLVSDYRFRGISRSSGDPAPQASVRVDTLQGFYASAWGSRVTDYAGADAEIDLYGGWTRDLGGWHPDAGVYGYLFPGGRGADFYEVYGALSRDLGPASATVGVNYAPPQRAGRDNVYVSGSLEIGVPRTPVTLHAGVGYEDGFEARRKLDWRLGARVAIARRFTLGLNYVDSSARGGHARAGAVASVGVRF